MTPMLTIASTFILAAITGLAVLAFKHPEIYTRIVLKIVVSLTLVILALILWGLGIHMAFSLLHPFITPDKLSDAKAAKDLLIEPANWVVYSVFLAFGYLALLEWFAKQVLDSEKAKIKAATRSIE